MKYLKILGGLVVIGIIGFLIYFFFFAAHQADLQYNTIEGIDRRQISQEARSLHERLIIADLHADNLLWDRDPLERIDHGHLDIPRLIEANVCLEVFDAVIKVPFGVNYEKNTGDSDQITFLAMANRWPVRTWSGLAERALYQSQVLYNAEQRSDGQLVIIESSPELQEFLDDHKTNRNQVAGILSIEGLHALEGKIENLDRFYEAGFRMMGLTHFFDNKVGGSSAGVNKGGLTEFGEKVIRKMDEMKIIIDLAHASNQLIADVLAATSRPVVVSHTGVKGTFDSPRNLSDDQLRAIARNGGLVGIGFWNGALGESRLSNLVKTIRYAVSVAGIDHVALGSDFDGATHAIFDVTKMVALTDALIKEGFTEEEIAKIMGDNQIRFMLDNLPDR